jgi:ketosteroid isomerase-like protein
MTLQESVSATTDRALRSVMDRMAITDTLYKYAACIDVRDLDGVRSVFSDDAWAQYGNADPLTSGDAIAGFIRDFTVDCLWQHHLLSVYRIDVDGDHATALVYHTSNMAFAADPETNHVLVGRYHDELRRAPDGWKVSKLVFEIVWGERRKDTTGYLEEVGGRGPRA